METVSEVPELIPLTLKC